MSEAVVIGLVGAIASILGALVGALFTVRWTTHVAEKQRRTDLTLQLYTEFQSEEMLRARKQALERINTMVEADTYSEHIKDLEGAWSEDDFQALMVVMFFFEKMELLRRNNYLDLELLPQLFKPHFSRWYDRLSPMIDNRAGDYERWQTVLANWYELRQHMYQNRVG